jgi:hypothetical protein
MGTTRTIEERKATAREAKADQLAGILHLAGADPGMVVRYDGVWQSALDVLSAVRGHPVYASPTTRVLVRAKLGLLIEAAAR